MAWELSLIFLGVGFGLLLIFSLLLWLNWKEINVRGLAEQERKQKISLSIVALLSLLAGAFWSNGFQLGENPVLVHRSEEQVELVGQVVSPARSYPNREVFLLRATGIKEKAVWSPINELTEIVHYSYGDGQQQSGGDQVAYGQQLKLAGQVRLPIGARNPGQFDYQQYLAHQRIYSQVVLLAEPAPLYSLWLANSYKEKSIEQVLPGREGNLLAAMTFGYREGLTEEDEGLFSRSCLYHFNLFKKWTTYSLVFLRKQELFGA